MITFTLVVALLLLLRRYGQSGDRRYLYVLPPMFVLWVNLHAGFTIGLLLLATTIFGEFVSRRDPAVRAPMRPLLVVAGLCALGVLVNPNGPSIYVYAAETQFSSAQQRFIVEWLSPNFHQASVRPFEFALLLLLGLLVFSRRRPAFTDVLLMLGGIVLALQSVRHIALFVALTTPILAELMQSAWDSLPRRPNLRLPRPSTVVGAVNTALLLLLAVVVLALTCSRARSDFRSKTIVGDYPVSAADALLRDPPPGDMYNQYGWGGYLVYRLWPAKRVFVYGEAAVMGDAFLNEYERIQDLGPTFDTDLEARKVSWVIFSAGSPLPVVLERLPNWAVTYRDPKVIVLVRRGPATDAYIARHPVR